MILVVVQDTIFCLPKGQKGYSYADGLYPFCFSVDHFVHDNVQ